LTPPRGVIEDAGDDNSGAVDEQADEEIQDVLEEPPAEGDVDSQPASGQSEFNIAIEKLAEADTEMAAKLARQSVNQSHFDWARIERKGETNNQQNPPSMQAHLQLQS
jgi:hypothetical protein